MKPWIAFVLTLLGWASVLDARVLLPESRHLAGPLDTLSSEVGEEFVDFPAILAPLPPAAGAQLSGWVEITFAEPAGDRVDFTVDFLAKPSDGAAIFGAGQLYLLLFGEVRPLGGSNGGTLDLESGEIVDFRLDADVRFSGVSAFGRNNRIPPRLVHAYGRDDFGVSTGERAPGFLQNDVSFAYDADGRITRFGFAGRTMFPIGLWAADNAQLEYFPPFAFHPGETAVFPNPDFCLEPSVPAELCPTDAENPDGLAFSEDAYFHSHLVLQSHELRPVAAERRVAPCAPAGRARGIVETLGGKLYHISGLGAEGLSDRVDVYDPSTGTWSETTPIPTPVYDAQSAVIGNRVYVIGGRASVDGPATAEVQVYDLRTRAWSFGASAPAAVARGSAEAYGDAIYVFFGMTNSADGELAFNESVLLYGPQSETWLSVPVPFQLEGFTSVISGGDIYLINGRTFFDGEEILSPFVFIFSTVFNDIFFTSPTRVGIYEGSAELVGDRLFLVGGRQEFGGVPSALVQMLELGRSVPVFDVFARSFWSPVKDLPFATTASGSAVVGGELFVVGGEVAGVPVPSAAVEQYDLGRGWQACETQPLVHGGGVLSAGSLSVGAPFLTPGGLSILEGLNLGAETLDARDLEVVPTSLGGVSVLVDGQPAPILAVSPTRVDFQTPYGVGAFGAPVALQVIKDGSPQQAPPVFATAFPVNPAFFVQSCGEVRDVFFLFTGSALACNADGTLNTFRNSARPGEDLTLQMTGLGPIDASLANGERAPHGVSTIFAPTITVTGEDGSKIPAPIRSIVLAPGEVGIYDVTITLPAGVQQSGRVVVEASLGGVPSNTVTVAVGEPVDPEPLACRRDTDLEFRACWPQYSPLAEGL